MHWNCDNCDKVIYEEFRSNHLQSGFHKRLSNSIIRKYIITNPEANKIDDIIRKKIRLHYKNYEKFQAILSVKLLMTSNQIKNNRRHFTCYRGQGCLYNPSFLSKIKIFKEQLYSQKLELRITFVSRFETITFDHYITKPNSMLEWKLLAMFDKNPKIVHSFDYTHTRCNHPSFRDIFDVYLDRFY